MRNIKDINTSTMSTIENTENIIKELRKLKNITQHELATELGVSQQDISKLETVNANITLRKLSNICDCLNIFPLLSFEPDHYITTIDSELISCFHSLKKLSPEKQQLVFHLIQFLS